MKLKPLELLLGLGALLLLFGKRSASRSSSKVNEMTFSGQLFTKNADFDAKVMVIATDIAGEGAKQEKIERVFNYLMAHMKSESGLDPTAHVNYNRKTKKFSYGLTGTDTIYDGVGEDTRTIGGGLFGLMRRWCNPPICSVPFDSFMLLSDLEQLDCFHNSIKPYRGKINSFADMRMTGFSPKFVGSAPSRVLYADDPLNPKDAYSANYFADTNKNGKIEAGELYDKWNANYNKWTAKAVKSGKPIQVTTASGK